MTYYSKYLKYKNKYLELKNMIGGDFNGQDQELVTLWKARSIAKKVFPVTYSSLKENYSHYCWISGEGYGLGFFLYRLKPGKQSVDGHVQKGNYALFHVKLENIGKPEKIIAKVCEDLKYSTTIVLEAKDNTKLPIGTPFDWSHCQNAWVYKVIDKQQEIFYKAEYK